MNEIKINLNAYVRVDLTTDGALYLLGLPSEPKVHDAGLVMHADVKRPPTLRCQFWEFMQLFGPVILHGGPELFNPNVVVEQETAATENDWHTEIMEQTYNDTAAAFASRDRSEG